MWVKVVEVIEMDEWMVEWLFELVGMTEEERVDKRMVK